MRGGAAASVSWRGFFVPTDRDQLLSEFIDAWNGGQRPNVDAFVERASRDDQPELVEAIGSFLAFAPTPSYSDEALRAIEAEAPRPDASLLAALMQSARERTGLTPAQVASGLVEELKLDAHSAGDRTAGYLERLEEDDLDPGRVSRKVFAALARLLQLPRETLEGAADLSRWLPGQVAPAPVFRADAEMAASAEAHVDLLADALAAPSSQGRDELDQLFLGGR
jgi:hypothetical protein